MDKSKVGLGCTVEFILFKQGSLKREQRLTIAGSGESDIKNHKIAFDSPLGKALNSMVLNEEKMVQLPGGNVNIKITGITYE
jgi:transcription elongation factor GreA